MQLIIDFEVEFCIIIYNGLIIIFTNYLLLMS
jgi:hypothetical protein